MFWGEKKNRLGFEPGTLGTGGTSASTAPRGLAGGEIESLFIYIALSLTELDLLFIFLIEESKNKNKDEQFQEFKRSIESNYSSCDLVWPLL